jgi:hypothetical protein
MSQIYFGEPVTTGIDAAVANEPGTVPASSVYTISVVNATDWTEDRGVTYATGQMLTNVGSGSLTAAGQYKVAAGVYTFDAADASQEMLISYVWTNATGGSSMIITSRPQGYGPIIELWFDMPYKGNNSVRVYNARLSGLKMPIKRNDYVIAEMDWEGFANPQGQVAKLNMGVTG